MMTTTTVTTTTATTTTATTAITTAAAAMHDLNGAAAAKTATVKRVTFISKKLIYSVTAVDLTAADMRILSAALKKTAGGDEAAGGSLPAHLVPLFEGCKKAAAWDSLKRAVDDYTKAVDGHKKAVKAYAGAVLGVLPAAVRLTADDVETLAAGGGKKSAWLSTLTATTGLNFNRLQRAAVAAVKLSTDTAIAGGAALYTVDATTLRRALCYGVLVEAITSTCQPNAGNGGEAARGAGFARFLEWGAKQIQRQQQQQQQEGTA